MDLTKFLIGKIQRMCPYCHAGKCQLIVAYGEQIEYFPCNPTACPMDLHHPTECDTCEFLDDTKCTKANADVDFIYVCPLEDEDENE